MRSPEDEDDAQQQDRGSVPWALPGRKFVLVLIFIVSGVLFLLGAFGVIELGTFDCSTVGCDD